jgi:hypothetical protein
VTSEITTTTELKHHLHASISETIVRIIADHEDEFQRLLRRRRRVRSRRNRARLIGEALGMLKGRASS